MKQVSGKDFCKVLERDGWTLRRISGSHHVYKKAGETVTLSVPVHGTQTLKVGLQADLMRAAGVTEQEL